MPTPAPGAPACAKSDCILGDLRFVMLYLGLVAISGLTWTVWRIAHALLAWTAR